MKHVANIDKIRVIIHHAPGIGHQTAAITAMKRLRTLGFKGVFDIRYHECEEIDYINTYLDLISFLKSCSLTSHLTGLKMETLINGYKTNNSEIDPGISLLYTDIGEITITRLPYKSSEYALDKVELTLCAADDHVYDDRSTYLAKYNTEHYIGLQPTNWVKKRFTLSHSGSSELSAESRLSHIESSIYLPSLNMIETRVLNICHNENFETQLLYALGKKDTGTRWEQVGRLINAHLAMKSRKHPLVLIVPYEYKDLDDIRQNITESVYHIDLKEKSITAESYHKHDVIIIYTGQICRELFHKLLGRLTTYPPVIEGCNTVDYCESRGLPYIIGGRLIGENYPYREELQKNFGTEQTEHCLASTCLSDTTNNDYLNTYSNALTSYLDKSSTLKNMKYHEARKELYLKRPDIVEESLIQSGYEVVKPK